MQIKIYFAMLAVFFLSACSTVDHLANTIDDLTVEEGYPITFHPEEEAFIDAYLESIEQEMQ